MAAVPVTGCDLLSTDPSAQSGSGSDAADKGAEAPDLADAVEAGDLPPVADRLPAEPLVVEPTERVGSYGGTWKTALLGVADTPWLGRTVGYECLMRWTPDWNDVIANVAKDIAQSADGTEFTITLREGMKWSDGEPFTADDLVFAYESVHSNAEITPVLSTALMINEQPLELEKVDEITVKITFQDPNGLFVERMAVNGQGDLLIRYPRHYLEQFHVDYNDQVSQLAEDGGFSSWANLFASKAETENQWQNPDLPRLLGWVPENGLGEGSRFVVRRNPYYWKTDPDGSQLPYIDEVVYEIITDEEVILLQGTNGELDFHTRHVNTLPNKPVLAGNTDAGEYRFMNLEPAFENEMVIALNLAHQDETLREVFGNRDFRIGLSYAINRDEMIDAVFQQQGAAWQAAPREASDYYTEEFATQYLQFDPELATEHLDRSGYTERDGEGFRLRPDGDRIAINVEVARPALIPYWTEAMELIVEYWADVGVAARVTSEDRSLFYERKEANEHDAAVWTGAGGLTRDAVLDPRWYFPFSVESNFAIPWAAWFSSFGAGGEEPPDAPRRQMELYWDLTMTPEEDQRMEIFREILAIAQEEFYVIGTVLATEGYGIVGNDFVNVPDSLPESHLYNTPAPANPEQFFFA